jgi:hypothetical protein
MDENLPPITSSSFQEPPKRNTRLIILVSVLVISVLAAGYYFIYQKSAVISQSTQNQNTNLPDTSTTTPITQPSSASTTNTFEWCMANGGKDTTPNYNAPKTCLLENRIYNNNCVSNDKFVVIAKDKIDEVGSDILVKYKASPGQNISCDYVAGSGDYGLGGGAEYILALENNFLITDTGTGPDGRVLTIYDLNPRKEVFRDSYSKPVDIKDNVINYWTGTTTPVTLENCPDYKEWETDGLGAGIDAYVSLDMSTLTKKELGKYHCSPRQ